MAEHKDLARGWLRTADGRAKAKRLWAELAELLNSLGGCVKTVQQWQKTWTDRKHITKKNAAEVRRQHTGTGGGPSTLSLAQWELRVLDIMGEGFGGRETTARVAAFPAINIAEEVSSYSREPEIIVPEPQPELQPEPQPVVLSENTGMSSSSAADDNQAVENRQANSVPTRTGNRQTRRQNRPISLNDRLVQLEREKIDILSSINTRLLGIERALLELVQLRRNNSS